MKKLKIKILTHFLLVILMSWSHPTLANDQQINSLSGLKIVTLGGSVTETVCALEFCDHIVGVDESSLFPESIEKKPKVGYYKSFSVEGILSLKPSDVITTEDAEPRTAWEQLRNAGIKIHVIDGQKTISSAKKRIRILAALLKVEARGEKLVTAMEADLSLVAKLLERQTKYLKVLFVYARGSNTLQVGGTDSAAAELIRLAGGDPVPKSFSGYRPLSAEGMVSANPDVILMTHRGARGLGKRDGVLKLPGVGGTNAGKHQQIVFMDDLLLLGFGPRLGKAVRELYEALYEDPKLPWKADLKFGRGGVL
jgi:iron complex transport system substrate-binding protein